MLSKAFCIAMFQLVAIFFVIAAIAILRMENESNWGALWTLVAAFMAQFICDFGRLDRNETEDK